MLKLLFTLCCIASGVAGCSKTDTAAPLAAPKQTPAMSPTVTPTAITAAPVVPGTPAGPLIVPPEDRLEPATIENARLPNGSALSVETPSDSENKKSRP